jgi:hypothetical protein
MNRYLTFSLAISVTLSTLAIPLRAANKPRAGTDSQSPVVWTNDDLEKLRRPGLISIVGPMDEEQPASASAPVPYEEMSVPESSPAPYVETQDPEWYGEQAARLRDELEYRQARLREYRQALENARSLRETTGGINLVGEDFAVTPEAGIEILQQRVNETQAKLDDLEDLARHNDIEPGTLRGQ